MCSNIKLPQTNLTVKRERFFLLVIIIELIFNLPYLIIILPSIIALFLVFSEKKYNHGFFSFYKYYVYIISIFNIISFVVIFIYFEQPGLTSFLFSAEKSDISGIHEFEVYILSALLLCFYFYKFLLAKIFLDQMNIHIGDDDNKNLQITISNENFDKGEIKKSVTKKLATIEEEKKEDEKKEDEKKEEVKKEEVKKEVEVKVD